MTHKVDETLRQAWVDTYMSLREYYLMSGTSPSKQELARSTRLSTTTIYQAEDALLERGYITAAKGERRSMRPTDLDLTLSREPLDPWLGLDPDEPKFWRL